MHWGIQRIAKTFDTVNHSILINNLYHIGIRGVRLDLTKSYLTDRKELVGINDGLSKYVNSKTEIPRGTALGP